MNTFILNGYEWKIIFVGHNSRMLVDRTGNKRLATTDPATRRVYLSNRLRGNELLTVLIHELSHCVIVSFNLALDIHRMVKKQYWIEAEEWLCNFIADYGMTIFSIAYRTLGMDALYILPRELSKFVS